MSQYVVMDLEWNQTPAFHSPGLAELPFEIIEIGAVRLDEHLKIVSEFQGLIRPSVYRKMNRKITEVTHLTMEELRAKGRSFPEVMDDFFTWCGDDYMFCTWGSMDLTELQRNMVYYGMELPFPVPFLYYDLQKLYGMITGSPVMESLDKAAAEMAIAAERPFHRAADDAWYTAKVMQKMNFLSRKAYVSTDYYRLPGEDEEPFFLKFPDYEKLVSHPYAVKEDILADRELTRICCTKCHRALRKKVRWFTTNQRYYYCLAVCPEHGYVCGKIRVKKTDDGRFFAVKTTRLTDESGVELVIGKKEDQRRKRAARNRRLRMEEAKAPQKTGLRPASGSAIGRNRRRKMLEP